MFSLKTNILKKFETIFLRVVMSCDEATQSVMSIKPVTYFSTFCFGHLPLFRGILTGSKAFLGMPGVSGLRSCTRTNLKKRPCATHARFGVACDKYIFSLLPSDRPPGTYTT